MPSAEIIGASFLMEIANYNELVVFSSSSIFSQNRIFKFTIVSFFAIHYIAARACTPSARSLFAIDRICLSLLSSSA